MSSPFQQQRAGKKRVGLSVLTWVASILAALGIGLAGITKFAAAAHWQDLFTGWGFPQWFLPVVGALEIAGAVALLIPRLSLYGALVLGSVMIGAIGTLLIYPTAHFPVMLPIGYIILLGGISIARVRKRTEPAPQSD
jgi:putative oxidoreductase